MSGEVRERCEGKVGNLVNSLVHVCGIARWIEMARGASVWECRREENWNDLILVEEKLSYPPSSSLAFSKCGGGASWFSLLTRSLPPERLTSSGGAVSRPRQHAACDVRLAASCRACLAGGFSDRDLWIFASESGLIFLPGSWLANFFPPFGAFRSASGALHQIYPRPARIAALRPPPPPTTTTVEILSRQPARATLLLQQPPLS